MERVDWDEYFYRLSIMVSSRATCSARKVGALVVLDKRILATGYNGSPPGQPHCIDVGCDLRDGRCIRTIHAEQNALIQCSLYGVSTKGATLYCTCRPCVVCSKLLVGAGIVRVVCPYQDDDCWRYMENCGVTMVKVSDEYLSNLSADK